MQKSVQKFAVAIVCAGSLLAGATVAEAKGCIKGALVGGVAGHYAGHHGFLGAAAGCLAGRHLAKQQRLNAAHNPPVTDGTH